ncbi:hypothetical protein Tco_0820708 [Tanacetum coccineum]|uniref:Uncharacterized protein n=1 Tax=Tanacetum coccineum TaxID=301880 RepID=A0ABQ5ABV0_9ASTR
MYAEVFGLDVPLTQSQPTESTQGTHRTPSAPRRSTRLTPPVPVPTVEKADEMILQDTLQVVIPVNVNEEEDEITDEVYELKRREKGKIIEESRSTPLPTPIRSPRTHTNLGRYTYLFEHLKERFLSRKSFDTLADHLQESHIKEQVMKQVPEQVWNQVPVYAAEGLILERQKAKEETERLIVKAILQEYMAIWLALRMKFERNTVPQTACRTHAVRPRDQDDPHDDAHPEGENNAKQQTTSEYEA